jgi:hypothetical protein
MKKYRMGFLLKNAEGRVLKSIRLPQKNYFLDLLFLVLLLVVTIIVTYIVPGPFTNIWYIFTLVLYSFSRNEALWLAFYLATVDGVMGLMGLYSLTLKLLPGLPGIELAQIYVIIALIKAARSGYRPQVYYSRYIQVLFLYVIFLIAWGQFTGFSGGLNAYFRVLKLVLPLSLFYSLPRLFTDIKHYERFFGLIFFLFLTGFGTQIFSLLSGVVPFSSKTENQELFSEPGSFRGFYNAASTLISFYAALTYFSMPGQKAFRKIILYIVIPAVLGMAVISATRGWIIGLGIIIVLQFFFMINIRRREVLWLGLFVTVIIIAGLSDPRIKEQVAYSKERLLTLGSLAEGDITADKTLGRMDVRSPVVMKAWKEQPLFGCGFSDTFWKYGDGHVGNQNVLLLSGIAGFLLLTGFLVYTAYKMTQRYLATRHRRRANPALIIFPVFLMGWFVIHSTSGQQFGFSGLPLNIIPLAVFFSFGALLYQQSKKVQNGRQI